MILSEIKVNSTKQKGIDQCQQILVCCDNNSCQKKYNISILARKKCFKKYGMDLCRGCQQREQYKNGERAKNQCYSGGKSAQLKMKGRTYIDIYGKEIGEKIREKQSKKATGKNNPMYGKNYQISGLLNFSKSNIGKTLEEIYGLENSSIIKNKLSKASFGENNPMFGKPSPPGSGNGWSGWYKGWYFRSLKELSYVINVIERFNLQWESAENKKYRIEYLDSAGRKRSYYPDFIINNKYLVEIKPKSLWNSDIVRRKKEAANDFCKNNGLKYKLTESAKPLSDINIKELIESEQIKFIDRYYLKFKQWEN